MQLPLPTGGDGVHIKHESAHIGTSAHTEALGGSLSNVIWQPTAAEIWLNKLKLLALGVILYKLKSSIRAAWKKAPMCRCVPMRVLYRPAHWHCMCCVSATKSSCSGPKGHNSLYTVFRKKHPLTFYFISP